MAEGKSIIELAKKIKINDDGAGSVPVIRKHSSNSTFATQDGAESEQNESTNREVHNNKKSTIVKPIVGIDIVPIAKNVQTIKVEDNIEQEPSEKPNRSEVSDFVSTPTLDEPILDDSSKDTKTPQGNEPIEFEASDCLPDENEKRTAEITDNMQAPKIYDTNEYFVPIKNTTHNHGGIQIIIAGLLSACIVAGIVTYVALYVL